MREITIIVTRGRMIGVRPSQTVQEMNLLEIKGCHFLLKTNEVHALQLRHYKRDLDVRAWSY